MSSSSYKILLNNFYVGSLSRSPGFDLRQFHMTVQGTKWKLDFSKNFSLPLSVPFHQISSTTTSIILEIDRVVM